jgi:hypothetical protein
MYFFSLYGAKSVETLVILRCVGIFVSATLPVLIIMGPKFTAIQYKIITGKTLWGSNGRAGKDSSSSASVAPAEGQSSKTLLVLTREAFSGKACTAMQVIPEKGSYEYRSPNNKKMSISSQSQSRSQSQSQSISDAPELHTPVEQISIPLG